MLAAPFGLRDGGEALTVIDENIVSENAEGEIDEVDEEVPVVVDADAIVNPRAVAATLLADAAVKESWMSRLREEHTDHAWQRSAGTCGNACCATASVSCTLRRSVPRHTSTG